MTGRAPRQSADRGMSTVVSHVLSIAITTLLIISLVATATGFLDHQKNRAAGEELETIAQRLASDLENADRLARQGDDLRVRSTLPESVAGSTYSARLLHTGASGDCGIYPTTDTCLRLTASRYDQTRIVPIYNATSLALAAGAGGQFTITSDGGSDTVRFDRRRLDMSPRVGIGQSVGSGPKYQAGSSLSEPPVPDFTITPGIPTTGTTITFDGSSSTDSDGTIASYEWDLDNDGTFEEIGVTEVHAYSSAGSHNVSLRVTDSSGLGATFTREIQVSGLEYVSGSLSTVTGNDDAIVFQVRNRFGSGTWIEIERVLIDPKSPDLDRLSGSDEIELHSPADTGEYDGEITIPEDGKIVELGDTLWVESPDTATIRLGDFPESATGETFKIGLRYRVNNTVGSTVIRDTPS